MNTPSFAHTVPQSSPLRDGSNATIEDIVRAQIGDLLLLHEDDFHGVTSGWVRVGDRKTDWVRAVQNGSTWVPVSDRSKPGEEFLRITKLLRQDRRMSLSRPRVARGKAKKDVGHGGLDEWFSGHGEGKGKAEGDATWGDWVAISPVKKKVERELADGTVKEKTVKPGDIVGPCGVSADPNWKDVTRGGKDPLKCMPRQKAHDMPRKERAELAKEKMRVEREEGNRGKAPTRTPTFEKEASDAILAGDNEPTKPSLWEEAKEDAKDKYTKWPSAYAVGHALKLYKERGGGWRKKAGWWESENGALIGDGPADVMQGAVNDIRKMYQDHPEIAREPTLEELWGALITVTKNFGGPSSRLR